jgi:hypothetical protein
MALGGAPLRAAQPVKLQIQGVREAPAGLAINVIRYDSARTVGQTLSYNLGLTIASGGKINFESSVRDKSLLGPPVTVPRKASNQSGIGAAVGPGAEWSPRFARLSAYGATLFGFNRAGSVGADSRPSVTVLDRRIVLSGFTLSRKRIVVVLSTVF